jgi:hypothetical protein
VNRAKALLGATIVLTLLALPGSARAEFLTGTNDTGLYSDTERDRWFDTTVDLEAGIVRLDVYWPAVAGGEPFNPADPADPAYNFASLDGAIQDATERNLRVLLTFYGAPVFAQGGDPPQGAFPNTWKPDPAKLGQFATAVATRYSGSYQGLPRVQFYEAWNEPNLDAFLSPQYEGKKQVGADRYRTMVNAVDAGVTSVHPDNKVVAGSMAPYGDPAGGIRTRPLVFLRKLLCLNGKLKGVKCPEKPRFDILSHHPINLSGPPRQSAVDPDDVSSPDLASLKKVLRAAERAKTIKSAKKRHPLWVTEFWWESFPDRGFDAIPGLKKHGRWIQEALYLFWKDGAKTAINLQLVDAPYDKDTARTTFQAGLLLEDGTPKPAYGAFRFPFVTERRSKKKLFAWGKSPAAGKLTIEKKRGKGWKKVKRVRVRDGQVFTTKLRARGKGTYRARIGADTSLPWKQGKKKDKIIEPGKLRQPARATIAPPAADPVHAESAPAG